MDREESLVPDILWEEIKRMSYYDDSEVPGYAVVSLNVLEDILKGYFQKDVIY